MVLAGPGPGDAPRGRRNDRYYDYALSRFWGGSGTRTTRLGAEANKHITAEGPSSLGPFQSRSLVSWAIERGVVSWPQFAACLFMDDVHFAFLVSLPLALPIHAFEHLRPSRSRTLPTVVQSHPPARLGLVVSCLAEMEFLFDLFLLSSPPLSPQSYLSASNELSHSNGT